MGKPTVPKTIHDRYSRDRGKENEDIIERILRRLMLAGVIIYYIRTQRLDALDIRGVDFIICLKHFQGIPLQVKSSLMRKEEHARRYNNIPCVVVFPFVGEEEMTRLLLYELSFSTEEVEDAILKVGVIGDDELGGF